MNTRKTNIKKQFVPGGVYTADAQYQKQAAQNSLPQQQPQQSPQQKSAQQPKPTAKQQLQPPPPPPKMTGTQESAGEKSEPARASQMITLRADCAMVPPTEIEDDDRDSADLHQGDNDSSDLHTSGGKLKFKKIFVTRKKSSVRIKEKKARQNRQLRKALLPKNAAMALNQVKGIVFGDYTIKKNNMNNIFTAHVAINGVDYEGNGTTKMAAKNSACEKALRDYVLAKMRQKPRLPRPSSASSGGVEPMDTSEDKATDNDTEDQDGDSDSDDVPMVNLASFAIYKLFTEWENEGFNIPELHPAAGLPKLAIDGEVVGPKDNKRNELPPNWESTHPATLLCMMRPGVNFTSIGTVGEKPNVVQCVNVVVDEKEFSGKGRSKKTARRNAAVAACNELFGTHFVKEENAAE